MLTIEGQIINYDKSFRGRIEISNDGIIASVGAATGQADIVLNDELIFPGFIDLHVHAREDSSHSQEYKEDFTSAGQAAINGGVVAFMDMPNNPTPPVDEESFAAKYQLAKKCPVDVVLYAGVSANSKPLAKLVPYKVFMGKSVGELFFESREALEEALQKYQGQNISFHCEDPKILMDNLSALSHGKRRPPEAEVFAIDFALTLIEKYHLIGKICHCSTVEGLHKITEAKKRGIKVTVEVTPHHLYYDETMQSNENKKIFQVNPPIRQSKENRLALIQALKNGDVDYLATDHAPHSPKEKQQGMSGLPHLDTYGPFATWLMFEHGFAPEDIARVCSFNPGKFINQFTPKKFGKIEPGFVGSLTVIDIKKPITIEKSQLKTKAAWSPFEGVEFPGSVINTVVRGKAHPLITIH